MIEFNVEHNYEKLFAEKHKKKQIILCNTASTLEDHLIKLANRYNGNYNKIPHFTISVDGTIYQHLNPEIVSNFMSYDNIDTLGIIITIENVGWLDYNLKNNEFSDWSGKIFHGDMIEKSWKNKRYWAPYKIEQILSLLYLLNYLCDRYSIEKQFTGNNVTINKPKSFKGIINRSNYNKNYYDLSPAMDFEYITNNLISNE
jgi:N-acetyl-anhydromuramyl-L-alanine amidase AmpD